MSPARRAQRDLRAAVVIAMVTAALMAGPGAAGAHEARRVGDHDVVVGWATEPAYAGFSNHVSAEISHGKEPIKDAELEVVVAFGSEGAETTTDPLPLGPAFDTPGQYLAFIIPSRLGTYSFQVTGMVEGEEFDETFTSGPQTFDDVRNPADAEFPAQDPTRGELSGALDRLTARIEDLRAEVNADEGGNPVAMWIAIGAGVVALTALVLAARKRPPA
jgi:hypothetical protein